MKWRPTIEPVCDYGSVDLCRFIVSGPAVVAAPIAIQIMLTKGDEWRVCFAHKVLETNREWGRCVAMLANACDVNYLIRKFPDADINMCPTELKKSRVLNWLTNIRDLLYAHSVNLIPNPVIVESTVKAGAWENENGVIFPNCRLKLSTFRKLSRRFMDKLRGCSQHGAIFPYLNHISAQEKALLCYQLCILYSNEPGVNTARELFFACCCEACCPQFFPSVPSKSPELIVQISDEMTRSVESQMGFADLVHKFGHRQRFVRD